MAVAKISLAVAILGFLLVQVQRQAGFSRLVSEPKIWPLLAVGLLCTVGAITLTFVRWHVLLTALGLEFRLRDTLRLGALGFALNFVSLGSIGGDLFKAIFAAKDSPGRRTEAVATVVVDRLVGVSMMLLLATAASFLVDWSAAPAAVRVLVETIRLATLGLIVGVALILVVPALSGEKIRGWVGAIPLLGPTAARLIATVATYRDEKSRVAKRLRDQPAVQLAVHPLVLFRRAGPARAVALAREALCDRPERESGRARSPPRPAAWGRWN